MKFHPICFAFAVIAITASINGCGPSSEAELADSEPLSTDVKPLVMPDSEASAEPASDDSLSDTAPALETSTSSAERKFSDDAFRNAALEGKLDTIQAALASGTDVNAAGPDGRIALQLAAFNGHTNAVRFLLENGASVNHLDKTGRTALMYASTGPNTDTVKLLLDSEAEIDIADDHEGFTALMFAAAEGQGDVVRALLAADANTEMTDIDGDTAKSFAGKNGHTHVVELLSE